MSDTTPTASTLIHLRPRNRTGARFVAAAALGTTVGVWLSTSSSTPPWLTGQLILAGGLVQWFVILHEAGHGTLFRARRANVVVGHIAGAAALIPFLVWRRVHARHHRWTGWQDRRAEIFTRSLRLPAWASRFALHFDAHELHHMYPFVPGYRLREIPYDAAHEVHWWRWTRAARAIPGEVLFFQNRDETGFDL